MTIQHRALATVKIISFVNIQNSIHNTQDTIESLKSKYPLLPTNRFQNAHDRTRNIAD